MLDAYARRARLTPAVIAGSPLLAFLIAAGFSIDAKTGIASLLVGALGVIACGFARDTGYKLQDGLWASWEGSPTTRRLRWRDTQKLELLQRLHDDIEAVTGHALPTAAEEGADPAGADRQYDAAIAILRNRTGDHKRFFKLFSENMEYGFRRNCLGLRPYGLSLGVGGTITTAVLCIFVAESIRTGLVSWGWPGLVSLVSFLFWWMVVKPEWVRMPAETYADRLLEVVDSLKADA